MLNKVLLLLVPGMILIEHDGHVFNIIEWPIWFIKKLSKYSKRTQGLGYIFSESGLNSSSGLCQWELCVLIANHFLPCSYAADFPNRRIPKVCLIRTDKDPKEIGICTENLILVGKQRYCCLQNGIQTTRNKADIILYYLTPSPLPWL